MQPNWLLPCADFWHSTIAKHPRRTLSVIGNWNYSTKTFANEETLAEFMSHVGPLIDKEQNLIVIFSKGRLQDPDNMIEVAPIRGCVPKMIRDTMNYLKTNIIQKKIHKPEDTERSVVTYNYPYQALEEAVVNSLYHRSYIEREPVEITIEPDKISILNFGGPITPYLCRL